MHCKNCGTIMNENQAICLNCGVKTGEGYSYCQNCGNPIAPNSGYCMNCGVAVTGSKGSGNLAGNDKTKIAIFAFFFGAFGVHNFMMGETKKGIVKLVLTFCTGIGSILGIIDYIKIITDGYTVDPEKFF